MSSLESIADVEAIRQVKARYWRGVDSGDGALVRSILARDCTLDFRGCCTDPRSGTDFLPAMNVVMRGRESWKSDALSEIVSVHHGHQSEITIHAGPSPGHSTALIFKGLDNPELYQTGQTIRPLRTAKERHSLIGALHKDALRIELLKGGRLRNHELGTTN